MRFVFPLIVVTSSVFVFSFGGCGAESKVAPSPEPVEAVAACRSGENLVPAFWKVLRSGKLEGLRQVVEQHLATPAREGEPSPINSLLSGVVRLISSFSQEPAESGAPKGELCAATPPSLTSANSLCELRRGAQSLIHEGEGRKLIGHVRPQIQGILNYIVGVGPAGVSGPHYEMANVVSSLCQQSNACQMSDTLELLSALLAYAETQEGKDAIAHLSKLLKQPALQPFLKDQGNEYGGESGVVALVQVVLTSVRGMEKPEDLDALPLQALPAELQPDLKLGVSYIKSLLSSSRQPNVMAPLRKALNCLAKEDRNLEWVRMLYRLGLEQELPEFGLIELADTLVELRDEDARGASLFLLRKIIDTLRKDEETVESLASACQSLMSNEVTRGQTQSNAQRILPVVSELFSSGLTEELICAGDSLLYGCSQGTSAPACRP